MSQLVRYLTRNEINPIDTLTGNTGGAVGPDGVGNINVVGTGVISVAGNPGTHTLTISSSAITGITITGDSGGALGPSNAFTFTGGSTGLTFSGAGTTETLVGTLNVAHGGTGDTSFTTYAPICGGTTTTGALQSASTGMGTSGWVLTSNGSAALPTWQVTAPSGIITINGDTGSVTGNPVTFNANSQAGSTVRFSGSGATMSFDTSDTNASTMIGTNAGSTFANTGNSNTALGYGAGNALNASSNSNTIVGRNSLNVSTAGQFNSALGYGTLGALGSGQYNVAIGYNAGSGYVTTNGSNIAINNNGSASESNVLRIGSGTGTGTQQLNKAFICGIDGVNVGSVAKVLTMASDQIGTATITAGTGITVTPGANTITIATTFVDFPFTDKSTSFSAASNNGYFVTGAATATMPASPSQGDQIEFIVDTASTLTITANTGQTLRIGSALSAAAGTAANNARGDAVTFIYRSAATEWLALSVIGTWTVT